MMMLVEPIGESKIYSRLWNQELTKLFGKERLSGRDGSDTDLSFAEYLSGVERQKQADIKAGHEQQRRSYS